MERVAPVFYCQKMNDILWQGLVWVKNNKFVINYSCSTRSIHRITVFGSKFLPIQCVICFLDCHGLSENNLTQQKFLRTLGINTPRAFRRICREVDSLTVHTTLFWRLGISFWHSEAFSNDVFQTIIGCAMKLGVDVISKRFGLCSFEFLL